MKKLFLSLILLLTVSFSFSQNVGVGTNSPNSSAALDITAANKGLLPPRVALTGINDIATIATPAAGLLVYNTATAGTVPNNVIPGYYYYTGLAWLRISNGGNAAGDMQYWNGTQWVLLPAGATGATLTMCNGVPTWGPCGGGGTVLPTVVTGFISNIAGTTASTGGNVTADGGATVTAKGICYSTVANPTILDDVVTNATGGTGSFSSSMTNLTPSTTYHVRAYATNTVGTAYGSDSSFTTTAISAPTITTTAAFGIGSTSANSGGTVTSNGGTPLTARGIVYSTSPAPTLSNSVLTDGGIAVGSFTSVITGLTANTPYYVRAYATNSVNTTYGNEISFTTLGSGFFSATYPFDAVTATSGLTDPTPVPVVTGLSFGVFTAVAVGAPTFNPTTGFRFVYTDWTLGATNGSDVFTAASDSTDKYYEVTITPNPGKVLNLTSMTFRFQRSGTGPRQSFVRSSVDGYANNLAASINPANPLLSVVATNKFQVTDPTTLGQDGCTVTLGGAPFTGITTPVTFRFYGVNAEAVTGSFSVDNVVFNGTVF
ncbi:MAG: hypothetical protein IPP72_18080 [Chitinophagaceae bacterium]|nr:hypothetical protein [Chitinophagaceae bacterium]